MSRIREAFAKGKAFIPFITCGDPDLETTAKVVRAAQAAGADLIELGIPFSDPTAEGPVIQAANARALQAGTTTDRIFDLVRDLRRDVRVPMVFMTYANVVFSYGTEKFLAACRDIGMDGLILPDVPFEEKEEFAPLCRQYGLDFISLIAPTSEHRIAMIAREASGFVYVVSSLGVTGMRSSITTDIGAMVKLVRRQLGHSLRGGLRHFHPGAGRPHGRPVRRGHCGQRHCQPDGQTWPGSRALRPGLRGRHEGRRPQRITSAYEKQEAPLPGCPPAFVLRGFYRWLCPWPARPCFRLLPCPQIFRRGGRNPFV